MIWYLFSLNSLCLFCWSHHISIIKKATKNVFDSLCSLCRNQSKSNYSVCSYSKCGKYIAAGSESGEFSVWDIDANKIIDEENFGDNEAQCITAIDWNPTNNGEFAYTDNTGQFGLIENISDSYDNIVEREEIGDGMDEDIDFGDSEY